MKKISILAAFLLLLFVPIKYFQKSDIVELRAQHKSFLEASPFKESLKLTKKERKANGLPPNKYFEREWELTLNPNTGVPEPEKVLQLQKNISKKRARKSPGDAVSNPWIERGPNNVSGRTRTILFDPNDVTNKRVFAGGVSGGLWVNNDITNSNSSWTQVSGVPGNMNVSCITVDPRNSNIWYIGTGEQYTSGAAVGNGVYKSIDGGTNWTNINLSAIGLGDLSGSASFIAGVYFINDIIAWDNGTSTELFLGVGASIYGDASNPSNLLGAQSAGLYRSVNSGTSWSRIESANMEFTISGLSFYFAPNDFEISSDNTIWMGTIETPGLGNGGGMVFSSTNGSVWTLEASLANSNRVELAASSSNASKLYALTQGTTEDGPHIYKTSDGFGTQTELSKPEDSDTGIEASDFTRGQSFYNLVIEVDPANDEIVYVGGIDLFRSANGGTTWSQISKWHSGISGTVSVVHADQHAMIFRPGNSDQAVFGNDGGVYYASTLLGSVSSKLAISSVNSDYNTTQFYRSAIAPTIEDEYFLGGTQDNGTPFFNNPSVVGPDSSIDLSGGDGAYCFVDQVGEDYLIVSYVYNQSYRLFNYDLSEWRDINSDEASDGDFINQADLDSNQDILYTNGSSGDDFRVFRYSNLLTIDENGTAVKDTLTDATFLDSAPTAFKVSPFTTASTTMLVGTETGKLLKVLNANSIPVWSEITGGSFVGSISDIQYGDNENEIYVTFHNYGVTSIWNSNDGGVSWMSKEGDFADIPVKSILPNPLNSKEVIIGTELGVWKTSNWESSSPNWVQTINGMSDVKVTDLQLRSSDNTVLAATFGRGLFSGLFEGEELSIQKIDMSNENIKLFPTLSDGDFEVLTNRDFEKITLKIIDYQGREVYLSEKVSFKKGASKAFSVSLMPGNYFVYFVNSNEKLIAGTSIIIN